MSIGLFIVIALIALVLCAFAGMFMFSLILGGEAGKDDVLRFDPLPSAQDSPGQRIWLFLRSLFGNRHRLLTYRRDERGRFRKTRR
jgi:hypothetical protein